MFVVNKEDTVEEQGVIKIANFIHCIQQNKPPAKRNVPFILLLLSFLASTSKFVFHWLALVVAFPMYIIARAVEPLLLHECFYPSKESETPLNFRYV